MSRESADVVAMAAALIGCARTLNVSLRETPHGTGLALAELNVLGGIERGYDLSSTLVRKLLLDAPRVSRIVDGFTGSGYVVREPDPVDRRRFRLRLTPLGADSLARGRAELGAAMDDLLGGLTDEERSGLEQAVPGLRRVLAQRTALPDEDAAVTGSENRRAPS
jgi:MarR family transcriptional regulator, organic hydroperoxide resistance regulator